MDGRVNKAIESLICRRAGEDVWKQIESAAGVEEAFFVRLNPSPDEITFRLLDAASRVLDLPVEDILNELGEYLPQYAAREGDGDWLAISGGDFKNHLRNLDRLCAQAEIPLPSSRPPSFRCAENSDNETVLHYYSTHSGFAPMVVGLLNGLGRMLNTEVAVTHTASRARGADHDEFLVRYHARVSS
ncbi:MAG: heme NO-binding domain-containing protein [Blastocatellia bacterium]